MNTALTMKPESVGSKVAKFIYKYRFAIFAMMLVGFALMLIGPSYADDLISTGEKLGTNIIDYVSKFYRKVLFPPAVLFTILSIVFTKDERKLAIEKKFLIGLIIAFLAISCIDLVKGALQTITDGTGITLGN